MRTTRTMTGHSTASGNIPDGGFIEETTGERTSSIELVQSAKGEWRVGTVKVYFSPEETANGVALRLGALVDAAKAQFAIVDAEPAGGKAE